MERGFLPGVAMALAAAFFVGTVNAVSKVALDAGAHPLPLSAGAYLLATLLFLPWLPRFRLHGGRRDVPLLAIIVIAGGLVAPLALFYGLRLTTAVTASLLVNLELVGTAILAVLFLRERVTLREGVALGVIGAGAIVVSVGPDLAAGRAPQTANLVGVALVALSSLAFSVDSTTSTPLSRRYAVVPLVAFKISVGAVLLAVLSWALTGHVLPPMEAAWVAAYNGTLGIIAPVLCFYGALRRIGAMRTTVVFSTAALWGALAGRVLLGEALTIPHLAGGLAMIGGVAWLAHVGRDVVMPTTPPSP